MYNTKGQSGKLIYSTFATLIQGSVFCFTIYINKHYTACLNITLFNEHDIYMDQKHVHGIMSWSQTTCGLYVQLETHKGNHYSGL